MNSIHSNIISIYGSKGKAHSRLRVLTEFDGTLITINDVYSSSDELQILN